VPAALKTLMVPPGPTGTTARLATVRPGPKLRLEATGRVVPEG
jgi:hypothetical protein